MENYKPGTIFELYKNDSQEYMVVNSIDQGNSVYLLVVPVYNVDDTVKTDYSKIMLLNVDKKTEEMNIETDDSIIKQIVDETMNKK